MILKEKIFKDVVNPSMKSNFTNAMGEIVTYDEYNNLAEVYISNAKDAQGITLERVPVQLNGKGVYSSQLKAGDMVYLQFNNGSIFQPKITGVADEIYGSNTREKQKHTRKGSFLVSIEKKDKPLLKSSSSTWIDNENKDLIKYYDFKDIDPIKNITDKMDDAGYFKGREVALFHPTKSSIVKLRDDGCIDIFTSTNIGVRINPQNKTIEMFGNVSTKSDKWTVLSNKVRVQAKEDIVLNAKSLSIEAKEIFVNGERKDV